LVVAIQSRIGLDLTRIRNAILIATALPVGSAPRTVSVTFVGGMVPRNSIDGAMPWHAEKMVRTADPTRYTAIGVVLIYGTSKRSPRREG